MRPPSRGRFCSYAQPRHGPLEDRFRLRQAAFLAQVGHESSQLCNLVENLNYRADRIRQIGQASAVGSRWRSLVLRADELGGKPEHFGDAVYGGHMGNGRRPLAMVSVTAGAG